MSVLAIGEHERKLIRQKVDAARKDIVPLRDAMKHAQGDDSPYLTYEERNDEIVRKRPPQELKLQSYRIFFSFEEQPIGLLRHISVSVRKAGKTPHPIAMEMIIKEFGFSGIPLVRPGRIWLEEFEPGHHAVNVAELEPT